MIASLLSGCLGRMLFSQGRVKDKKRLMSSFKAKLKKPVSSKEFILKHTEDFLNYAVDYSMNEKIDEYYRK